MKTKQHKFRPQWDCDENGQTNADRAERGAKALLTYNEVARVCETDDPFEAYHIQDLLCDLMHLCDREKVDFHETLGYADACYEEER